MFETLAPEPEDQIMALGALFRADPRQGKIDLGIGVYRDADGRTPVMAAVREAERRIWEGETTKSYTALVGDAAFNDAIAALVLARGSRVRAGCRWPRPRAGRARSGRRPS